MKSVSIAMLLVFGLVLVSGCVTASKATAPDPATAAANPPTPEQQEESGAVPDVAGSWRASWTAADGSRRQGTMRLTQNGSKLSGSFRGQLGSTSLQGSLRGNRIILTMQLQRGPVSLTGTIHGDRMSGTTARGVFWAATREQGVAH